MRPEGLEAFNGNEFLHSIGGSGFGRGRLFFVLLPQVESDGRSTYVEIGTNQSDYCARAMRLSNLADYAVVTMSAAARHCGGGRTSAAELAAETGLPAPTVAKLVSRLTAAGLLRSARGARGGLQLARPAAAITLADIVEAVEGPIALAACAHGQCAIECSCTVRPHWNLINTTLRGALAGVPLTQLAQVRA